jgi:UPF0716 protein FxsA
MFAYLFLLFIFVPIIEIALFIQIGGFFGVGLTILFMLGTAILGASLVRREGMQTLMLARQRLEQGELPGIQLAEGVLLLIAGVLLVTPGFLTDGLGFFLLFPASRRMLATYLLQHVHPVSQNNSAFSFQFGTRPDKDKSSRESNVIEGEFKRKD